MSLKTKLIKRTELLSGRTRSFLDGYVFNYHERIHRDNLAKMLDHLDNNHPVKMFLSEQRKMNYALSLLEKTRDKFQKCNKFECVTVGQWQLLEDTIENFKKFDQLFHEEETLLFPELIEYGFGSEVRQIVIGHDQVHELILRLISAYENGVVENYSEISSAIEKISQSLAGKIRLLIHRESYILYPRALRVISGQSSWRRLREIAGKLHVRLTDVKR